MALGPYKGHSHTAVWPMWPSARDTTAGPWARGPMVAVQLGHDGWTNTTDPVLRL